MSEWIKLDDKRPPPYVSVLTQHIDDLYPVAAFWMGPEGCEMWLRETEGPEDLEIEGRHIELYRPPTHWKELPPSPFLAGIEDD